MTTMMQVPRIEKITLNMGVGEAKLNAKALDGALDELTLIAGQRARITRAKKSIAGFKIRAGMPIGAKVTLRGARMWEFLDRLVSIALPRIRDFRGLPPTAFDGRGNYSLGVREQIIFPEINYDDVDSVRGSTSRSRPPRSRTRRRWRFCASSAFHSSPRTTRGRRRRQAWRRRVLIAKASPAAEFKSRRYTRCNRCGRPRSVYKKFGLCRICLRDLAHEGVIPGMTKSSW